MILKILFLSDIMILVHLGIIIKEFICHMEQLLQKKRYNSFVLIDYIKNIIEKCSAFGRCFCLRKRRK